jgi:hypothetical protein
MDLVDWRSWSLYGMLPCLHREIIGPAPLIWSPQMAKVAEDILIAAPDDITVLITGEPGTGKESAAHAIHHLSGRLRTTEADSLRAIEIARR